MREILFKGKRIDHGEWVNGSYHYCDKKGIMRHRKWGTVLDIVEEEIQFDEHWILIHQTPNSPGWEIRDSFIPYAVVPDTLSQYIGIKDKVGCRIFENSILRGKFGTGIGTKSTKYKEFNFIVTYHGESPEFHLEMPKNYGAYRFCPHLAECVVIGNKFDHPELLNSL